MQLTKPEWCKKIWSRSRKLDLAARLFSAETTRVFCELKIFIKAELLFVRGNGLNSKLLFHSECVGRKKRLSCFFGWGCFKLKNKKNKIAVLIIFIAFLC